MLVDREVMVHVERRHRDDAPEVRDEPSQHAGFVHISKRGVRSVVRGQAIKKQLIGFGVGPEIVVYELERGTDKADCLRMDEQVVPLGLDEEPDQVDRVLLEGIRLLDVQAVVVDPEIGRGGELGAVAPWQRAQKVAHRRHSLELPQLKA